MTTIKCIISNLTLHKKRMVYTLLHC